MLKNYIFRLYKLKFFILKKKELLIIFNMIRYILKIVLIIILTNLQLFKKKKLTNLHDLSSSVHYLKGILVIRKAKKKLF